jgi:hypothetical protein
MPSSSDPPAVWLWRALTGAGVAAAVGPGRALADVASGRGVTAGVAVRFEVATGLGVGRGVGRGVTPGVGRGVGRGVGLSVGDGVGLGLPFAGAVLSGCFAIVWLGPIGNPLGAKNAVAVAANSARARTPIAGLCLIRQCPF